MSLTTFFAWWKKKAPQILFLQCIFVLIFAVIVNQVTYDFYAPPFTTRLALAKRVLLPEKILPYLSFGFNNFLSDIYWVRSIQDFVAWNGKEGFFIGYFENITALDPKFEYPYLFGILTIPQGTKKVKDVSSLEKITPLAERGIDAIKTSWQIPFYLGTQYYIFTKSYPLTEKYLKIASGREGAPQGVSLLYATIVARLNGNNADTFSTTRDLIKVIYDTTDNEVVKSIAGKGIQMNVITQALERGIVAYKVKNKKYPRSVEDLMQENFVKLPEELLNNFVITINEKNGSYKIAEK
jgi:hypothetical protein